MNTKGIGAKLKGQDSPFLTTKEAAYYLILSYRTLEKMRTVGHGPPFRKHGRYIRYHIHDLDHWSEASIQNLNGPT